MAAVLTGSAAHFWTQRNGCITYFGSTVGYAVLIHSWLLMTALGNHSKACLSCHIQIALPCIASYPKEPCKAALCLLHSRGGWSMRSEELLAPSPTARGERGAGGFSEGHRVARPHAAHVTCKQFMAEAPQASGAQGWKQRTGTTAGSSRQHRRGKKNYHTSSKSMALLCGNVKQRESLWCSALCITESILGVTVIVLPKFQPHN